MQDSHIVENASFFAMYDDFPVSLGHTLIVPRAHVSSLFDLQSMELVDCYALLAIAKRLLDEKHNPDGYNIGINEGPLAGQTIPHLHIHLIPRYRGDVDDPIGGVRNVVPSENNIRYYESRRKPMK
jgi:diadenosine tetraphosphate (Ap4A) HIT family hydrolase